MAHDGPCACGERTWDFETTSVRRSTWKHLPGLIQFAVPLPLDYDIMKICMYDLLALAAPVEQWNEPAGCDGMFGAAPMDGNGASHGARNYLLGKDAVAGNSYFKDLMINCKTFMEGKTEAEIVEFNSMECNKRPLCGDLTFQVFTHKEEGKGVVIYSPCKFSEAMKDEFNALGGVKGIVVPHAFHTAFVEAYLKEWPDLVMYCGPGLTAEVKPLLFERTTGAVFLEDTFETAEALAFSNEYEFSVYNNMMGGFGEANMFHKPSGVLCTSDLIYRGAQGPTFDWCTPNEDAPEWEWVDVLYRAPQYFPVEDIDPKGGINAFYRYYIHYTLGTSEVCQAEFEKVKALPGLRSIAACHADCAGHNISRGLNLLERCWKWRWETGDEYETMIRTYYYDQAKAMFDAASKAAVASFSTTTTTVTAASADGVTKTTTTTVATPGN